MAQAAQELVLGAVCLLRLVARLCVELHLPFQQHVAVAQLSCPFDHLGLELLLVFPQGVFQTLALHGMAAKLLQRLHQRSQRIAPPRAVVDGDVIAPRRQRAHRQFQRFEPAQQFVPHQQPEGAEQRQHQQRAHRQEPQRPSPNGLARARADLLHAVAVGLQHGVALVIELDGQVGP